MAAALALRMEADLERHSLRRVLAEQELPVAFCLAALDLTGVGFDAAVLNSHSRALQHRMAALEADAKAVALRRDPALVDFSISSPIQVSHLLFEVLKLEQPGGGDNSPTNRKLRTAHKSTDEEALQRLRERYEGCDDDYRILSVVQQYRKCAKMYSTYIQPLVPVTVPSSGPQQQQRQQRLYTNWNQTMTGTGRLSSSNCNLQNVPHSVEVEGVGSVNCRAAFRAGPGRVFVSADYSQIEMRVLAHLCGEGNLKTLFRSPEVVDIYRAMAARHLGTAEAEVDPETRRRTKATCLGLIYGAGVRTLATQMDVDVEAAAQFRRGFLQTFREVVRFTDETIASARSTGHVQTCTGRVRWLPKIKHADRETRAESERQAVNTRVQGSASDILKKALLRLSYKLRDLEEARGSASPPKLCLTLHDEFVVECDAADTRRVARVLHEAMVEGLGPDRLSVPLAVKICSGES
eukprot:GHVU01219861.1.p1 GENE.GHVU01219861.1~~GHVU01219861.1.p1  ORF type:complete len:510 (-),score=119.68 GHVU01219861.1:75-1469(-)